MTRDVLGLCDEKRDLKKRRYDEEGVKENRKASKGVQKSLKKAKGDWIDTQCKKIDACLNITNSKKAYQLVKDLTSQRSRVDTQLSRTSLENVLQKKKRFSADG